MLTSNATTLRLSAQRALLGAVPPSLRAFSVSVEGTVIRCRSIFETRPSADDWDLLSAAGGEIAGDFPETFTLNEEFVTVVPPGKMEHLDHLVYLRFERESSADLSA